MDLEISPGDTDRTHRIGVPAKGKNRHIIVKFVRYMDKRRAFYLQKETVRKKHVNYRKFN